MDTATLPATCNLALLADLDPATCRPDRIHAVMAWSERGDPIYQPLSTPGFARIDRGPQLSLDLDAEAGDRRPTVELGDFGTPRSSSSGRTWRTWALPTIPPALRHLPPTGLVRELARRLGG